MQWSPRAPRDDVNVSPTHPLAEALTLLAGVALALVALVLIAWALVEVAVRWLPYDLEARLFSGLRPALTAVDSDTEGAGARRAALQALLDRLVAHWPERPFGLEAGIVASDEPNAVALPGGVVLVSEGLLARTGSENELAFVLAHEIGHFRDRDHLRNLGRAALVGLALAAAGIGEPTAVAVSQPFVVLAGRGFDRSQEREADRFALGLVAAEYGHAAGAADFFRRQPDAEAGAVTRVAGWVSTHPVSADRIADLEAEARARGLALEGPTTPLAAPLAHE